MRRRPPSPPSSVLPRPLALALLAATIALGALGSPAAAQDGPLLELVPVTTEGTAGPGETTELVWRIVNHDERAYLVIAEADLPSGTNWEATAAPQQTEVAAGGDAALTLRITAPERPSPRMLPVTLSVVAVNGTMHRLEGAATVEAIGVDLVLGNWENPLPAPLDGTAGVFLLNVVAWLVISLAAMWLIDPTLRALTRRTKTEIDDHIIQILRGPVFLVLFTFGFKQSLEVFALPLWAFRILDRLWVIVLVVALVYVVYRGWHEIVLHYGRRIAAKSETKFDDRLVPVFDKLGGLIIIIVGMFYIISSFGIDLTIFAAGGVLGAMVIAFAAQDTLANFFAGVHLLIDQPFKEGDDIILDSGEVTTVTKIGLRSTHLYHVANHETIIVPNNMLATNRIINLLKPDRKYKVRVDVGVAYGTDVQKVMDLLLDIARSHPLALHDPDHAPFARFQNFGDSSLDFSVHLWIEDVYTRFAIASDIRELIDRRFAAEGIEIPFPQRVIWNGREEQDRAKGSGNGLGGGTTPLDIHHSRRRAMREQASATETGSESGGGGEGGEASV